MLTLDSMYPFLEDTLLLPWSVTNYLTSVVILNEIRISEARKLILAYERKHGALFFWSQLSHKE